MTKKELFNALTAEVKERVVARRKEDIERAADFYSKHHITEDAAVLALHVLTGIRLYI